MNIKRIVILVVGVILALLGSLWFLQGTGIVHLSPIMCVAECEPITGTSLLWAVIGAMVFVGGIFLIRVSLRRKDTPVD